MRTSVVRALLLVAAVVIFTVATRAQEGYPLTGTWYGDYGSGNAKKDITLVMTWDGSKATGLVNPGPGSTAITSVVLDVIPGKPGTASLNNPGGTSAVPPVFNVKIVIGDLTLEGKMQNPVGGNRSIVGTYTKGSEKGPFQIKHL